MQLMKWQLPNIEEKTIPKNFSKWVYLLIFVISFLFYIIFIFIVQNDNDAVFSQFNLIFIFFIIAPILFGLSVMGFLYSFFFYEKVDTLIFNHYLKNMRLNWQSWCQSSINLIDYHYITGIDNVSLKIMKIEGHSPTNPDKVIPISAIRENDSSPLFYLFDKILLPMKSKLNILPSVTILLNTNQDQEVINNALMSYSQLNELNIHQSNITFSNIIPSIDKINDWIDDNSIQNILLINLLFDTETQLQVTEYCCALLFSNDEEVLNQSPLKINLFRSLNTNLTNFNKDLKYFLDSKQVQREKINQAWTLYLPSPALHSFKATLFDPNSGIKLEPNKFYQLEINLGKLDYSHAWLALSLAADGIVKEQKGQIIATQNKDSINIMQLSDETAYTPTKEDNIKGYYPTITCLSCLLLLFCICLTIIFSLEETDSEFLMQIGVFSFIAGLFIIGAIIVGTLYQRSSKEDDFIEMWFEEQDKISNSI